MNSDLSIVLAALIGANVGLIVILINIINKWKKKLDIVMDVTKRVDAIKDEYTRRLNGLDAN